MAYGIQNAKDTRSSDFNYQMAIIQVRFMVSQIKNQLAVAGTRGERAKLLLGFRDMAREFESWLYPYLRLDNEYQRDRTSFLLKLDFIEPNIEAVRLDAIVEWDGVEYSAGRLYKSTIEDWLDWIILKFSALGLLMPVKIGMDNRGNLVGDVSNKINESFSEVEEGDEVEAQPLGDSVILDPDASDVIDA
jgi:hypothetical protein